MALCFRGPCSGSPLATQPSMGRQSAGPRQCLHVEFLLYPLSPHPGNLGLWNSLPQGPWVISRACVGLYPKFSSPKGRPSHQGPSPKLVHQEFEPGCCVPGVLHGVHVLSALTLSVYLHLSCSWNLHMVPDTALSNYVHWAFAVFHLSSFFYLAPMPVPICMTHCHPLPQAPLFSVD